MRNLCSVADCSSFVISHSLCDKHYRRLRRHGNTEQTRPQDWGKKESHPLYLTWCQTKRTSQGRDKSWDDFWTFVADVGEKPGPNYRLVRMDLNSKASKINCKWSQTLPTTEDKKEYQRRWRKLHPEKAKEHNLKKSFGISLQNYKDKLKEQNNVCAICFKPELAARDLAVDHCHTTGKIRGLLCTNCNKLLGHAKDNVEILQSAINYLNKHHSTQNGQTNEGD
jgi:hypothetical protein